MTWRSGITCAGTFVVVVVVAMTATLLASDVAAQQATYTVRVAQIVHHHGVGSAATDALLQQQQDGCGIEHPCGSLSASGMQMLSAIGAYVRTRYNNPGTAAVPFFASRAYNATSIYSTASDLTTTIQSANAFLQGLFPSTQDSSPAIFTASHTTDARMTADALPFVWVRQDLDNAGLEAALRADVDARLDDAAVSQMAAEAALTSTCADATQRVRCVLRLYNAYATRLALDELSATSALRAHAADLTAAWTSYAQYVYAYDASNADDRARGSAGQRIAAALLQTMRDSMTTRRYAAYQYSADTTMLTPLALTLGMRDAAALAPAFGTTLLLELLQSATDGSYHVRVLRGAPSRLIDGSYTYTPIDTVQTCTSANGTSYVAANNICPFDDFARYVAQTNAATTTGYCALSSSSYALLGCPTSPSDALSANCARYRALCPAAACPTGYTLAAADARCYEMARSTSGEYVVRLVQVVHRHGARQPELKPNATQVCGGERECDRLNSFGIRMLHTVGSFLRSRYNNVSIVGQPMFASERYDPMAVYSRSTTLQRTLQSASSLLHGLFPDGDAFVPAIFTVNYTTDVLLHTDVIPSVYTLRYVDLIGFAAKMNPIVDSYFTYSELQGAAEETSLWRYCTDFDIRYKCVFDLFDVATSYNATGRLREMPRLAAMLDRLNLCVVQYYHYVFDYNASNPLHRRQGPVVYQLAETILANMRAHIVAPSYKMYHYSAHDTTVAPLSAAYGDITDTAMLVPYGVTMITELLQDTGDGSYHVRVLRGYPDGNYTSDYTFRDMGFEQHCLREDGTEYIQAVCPLADFARFIESRKPIDPDATCVISEPSRAQMLCPAADAAQSPSDYYCMLYRTICPATSCPTGYALNAANFQCIPLTTANASRVQQADTTPIAY